MVADHREVDGQTDMVATQGTVSLLCYQPMKVQILILDQDSSAVNRGHTVIPKSVPSSWSAQQFAASTATWYCRKNLIFSFIKETDGRSTCIQITLTLQSCSKNQKANLRALCCTEHHSTPLWQQKQCLTCRYLVVSWVQQLLRLNPHLMGIWVGHGMLLCSVQRLREVRDHKTCYGISGVMCNTYKISGVMCNTYTISGVMCNTYTKHYTYL